VVSKQQSLRKISDATFGSFSLHNENAQNLRIDGEAGGLASAERGLSIEG
jgi:hypothetical protein